MGILQAFTNRNARKDERIIELEQQVARLTMQSTKLAEEKALLVAEKERLELTWKTHCDDLQARHDRLRADNIKWSQEAKERFETIGAMRLTLAELLPFLRNIKRGVFRSDRGGSERYEALRSLISKYDKATEAKEQAE